MTGIFDSNVSVLVPIADPTDDPFEGLRPQRLSNGSWPWHIIKNELQGEEYNRKNAARVKANTTMIDPDEPISPENVGGWFRV